MMPAPTLEQIRRFGSRLQAGLRRGVASLGVVIVLNLVLAVLELLSGLAFGSLTLRSDAFHNFLDALSLGVSAGALVVGGRPPTKNRPFGLGRVNVAAALVNAVMMLVPIVQTLVEALGKLTETKVESDIWTPPAPDADLILWVGLAALAVNGVSILLVRQIKVNDINIKSAGLHIVLDFSVSILAVVSVELTKTWHNQGADVLFSVAIGAIFLYTVLKLLGQCLRILLELPPPGFDFEAAFRELSGLEGVEAVVDLRVWSLDDTLCHGEVRVVPREDPRISAAQGLADRIEERLRQRCGECQVVVQFLFLRK